MGIDELTTNSIVGLYTIEILREDTEYYEVEFAFMSKQDWLVKEVRIVIYSHSLSAH